MHWKTKNSCDSLYCCGLGTEPTVLPMCACVSVQLAINQKFPPSTPWVQFARAACRSWRHVLLRFVSLL